MRRIDGLSKAQRVVLVIALGLALGALGSYLASFGSGAAVGWIGYAPLTSGFYPGARLHPWVPLVVWLVLIGIWAVVSVRVMRPSSDNAASDQ
jgi:hypothetical protein